MPLVITNDMLAMEKNANNYIIKEILPNLSGRLDCEVVDNNEDTNDCSLKEILLGAFAGNYTSAKLLIHEVVGNIRGLSDGYNNIHFCCKPAYSIDMGQYGREMVATQTVYTKFILFNKKV